MRDGFRENVRRKKTETFTIDLSGDPQGSRAWIVRVQKEVLKRGDA